MNRQRKSGADTIEGMLGTGSRKSTRINSSRVFLTGYQGETIEAFLQKLKGSGVEMVIDVREVPLSRKNGFSKKHLSMALSDEGIDYLHFEKLGSPSAMRKELHTHGDILKFFTSYRKYARTQAKLIRNVLEVVKSKHSAIMCFEKDCELCHRTILASELQKRSPTLQVIPL